MRSLADSPRVINEAERPGWMGGSREQGVTRSKISQEFELFKNLKVTCCLKMLKVHRASRASIYIL